MPWVEDDQQAPPPQGEGQWVEDDQQAAPPEQEGGQWVESDQPEPEGALGSAVRAGAHAVIPTIAGAAGFGAGALLGNLPGGLLGGIGAASLAGMAQEKLLKTFGFDDEAQQAANRQAHPWATGFGEVAAAAPTFGVGAEAMLAQRALTAGIGGATDLIMGGDPQHAAAVAAGSALLGKPTQLGESLIGAGETAGKRISSLLARSKADLEGAGNLSKTPTGVTPDAAEAEVRKAGVQTPHNQGGSSDGAGTSTVKGPPLTEGPPSGDANNQVTGSEQQYGKAAANEVSPPVRKAGEVPEDIQAALKPADAATTPPEAPSKPADAATTPPEPPEIAMLREAAANRTNKDVIKGPVLDEEGGVPSPELNEATRQAVEAAGAKPAEGGMGGGEPPVPPKEPPPEEPAAPIPPERYTGGKFDTPLNAANTVNNALDNVMRNQAALWHGFRNLLKDITNKDSSLMGKGGGDISRAIERSEFDKLDPKVQDAYNKHIGPIDKESEAIAAELAKREIKPLDEDMAPNYIMHNRKMPFSLKEFLDQDPTGMLQGMKNPTNFKGLEYRGAVADDGSRLSIRDLGDKYSIGKNGEESFYNKPELTDVVSKWFKNGDKIEYNGKTYKIDRGIQDEITRDFRDAKGRPIEYHQNAILSALERNAQLKAALQFDDMMRTFKMDKALDPYRTTLSDPKASQLAQAGWEKVDSPGFENILMHPDMAQAIKNNFEPGLFKNNPITNFTRAMNQFAVRSIFWNPVPHSLNAAVHYIVARGVDWLPVQFEPGTYKVSRVTLDNYRNLMSSLSKAWDTVVNQGPDLVKLNNAGLPMVWSSIERQRAHELTGKLLDTSLKSEPKFWAGMADKFGLGAPVDAVRAVYNSSAHVLWGASDIMTAARYYELMGHGLSSDEAISHMSIHMPDYRPALNLLGVRGLPSAMGDSTLFMFGRYHAGMLRSLENMTTGALGKNSTVDERRQAFGNIGALFVMGAIMMPMLDKAAQVITGNKDAEVRRSGPLSPIKNTADAVKGEGSFGRTLGNLNTLSPLANAAVETLRNKDYANKNIIEPMSPFYKKAEQYADYLGRNMVAPYGTAVKMANPKGPGAASTLVRELTGVKAPTEDEKKGKAKGLDRAQRDAAYRDKHPRGMLESLVNQFTPRSPSVRQKDAQP